MDPRRRAALSDPTLHRVTESRVGRGERVPDALARWGAEPKAPWPGARWYDAYRTTPAVLQNGLTTEREWVAYRFAACLIRGFCELDPLREALAPEGLHPVGAVPAGASGPMAMATIWLNKIEDSVCGAYDEVVLSFDASTKPDQIAFRAGSAAAEPWLLQYANFGSSVCEAQLLHSLWIDSPLSIAWGREMQAFPKHPRPVASTLGDAPDAFSFDLRWDEGLVMSGRAGKRFPFAAFVREGLGLVAAHGVMPVTRFLAASSFDVPIVMPKATAAQNGVGRRYVGHLWKGLDARAVQVWPWTADDRLELGTVELPSGAEPHNGHALLGRARFRPVVVSYLPRAAGVVEAVEG